MPGTPRIVGQVNTTSLEAAITLARGPMQSMLDPDHGGLPYFLNSMGGGRAVNGHHISWSLSDVPQRFVDALLDGEEAIGLDVDQDVLRVLAGFAHRSLDNGPGLPACLSMETFEPIPVVDPFNYREALYAMSRLHAQRGDPSAPARIRHLVATIDRYLDTDDCSWDERRFHADTGWRTYASPAEDLAPFGLTTADLAEGTLFPRTFGRMVGGLVRAHRATGLPEALDLAERIGAFARAHVLESSRYRPEVLGTHVHSITSMLTGLALLAEQTGDLPLLDRLEAFCADGLSGLVLECGWSTENTTRTDHHGEANNTADVVEAFLAMGRMGRPEYFGRAERMLRGHLLPSQLRDISFLSDESAPGEDRRDRVATRSRGAFGFACPYGHESETGESLSFNWDVTGGAVLGLCEAAKNRVTRAEDGTLSVNLLFDAQTAELKVESPYSPAHPGTLVLRPATVAPIRVRRPEWLARTAGAHRWSDDDGRWLRIRDVEPGERLEIPFPLASRTTTYPLADAAFAVRWEGDAVVAATGLGHRLRFFPELGALRRVGTGRPGDAPAPDVTFPRIDEGIPR